MYGSYSVTLVNAKTILSTIGTLDSNFIFTVLWFIVNASKEQQLSKAYRVAQETVTELLIYLLKSSSQLISGEVVTPMEESGSEASDEE